MKLRQRQTFILMFATRLLVWLTSVVAATPLLETFGLWMDRIISFFIRIGRLP